MRKTNQEIKDPAELREIVRKSDVCHIAMHAGEFPYVIAMNYGYEFAGEKLTLYFHCAKEGRKIDLLKADPKVGFMLDCDHQYRHLDRGMHCTMDYQSIIGEGIVEFVEDYEEFKKGISLLFEHSNSPDGFPLSEANMKATTIFKINVQSMTGKRKIPDARNIIESNIDKLRDPCILVEGDTYYAYGSGWVCYKNTDGDLSGNWVLLDKEIAVTPPTCKGDKWAPEVHKYKGSYYMFTTYSSSVTGHRGSTILRSDSPEGPFVEITNGHLTPADWDCIDSTFYVDPEGQPWMVFVHEWTSTDDGIGRMAIAKLSDDLTNLISEPVELFRANDPSWTEAPVTDGCWMYTTEEGRLLMIWSNFDIYGYCVGIAHSDNGRIDGNWIQEDRLLYSKRYTQKYDGGHGMIFTGLDGVKYLSIHSPNAPVGNRKEKPVFIPIREENGTLVCDF